MLTDDMLDEIAMHHPITSEIPGAFRDLLAQAREANALRAEVERLRTSNTGIIDNLAFTEEVLGDTRAELVEARHLVSLLGDQLAEAMKVADVTGRWNDEIIANGSSLLSLDVFSTITAYRAWIASHPRVTYAGLVTATVDGEVKT